MINETTIMITNLDNVDWNIFDLVGIVQDEGFLKEDGVDEVVALDPCEGCSKVQVVGLLDVGGVRKKLAGSHLPQGPLLGSCSPDQMTR